MKLFRLSAAVLALAAGSAFAQTQPIPGAVQANGQPANVQGTAIVVAPSGGGAGRGVVVAADRPLPVTCVTGCSGGGGGGNTTVTATAAAPSYVEGSTTNPLSSNLAGSLRTTLTTSLPAGTANIGSITNVTGTVSLPTGAATAALQGVQGTGSTYNPPTGGSGEIGYLSGIYAAAIDPAPVSINQTQINGVTVSTGSGANGTGVQRVTLPTDGPTFGVTGAAAPSIAQLNGVRSGANMVGMIQADTSVKIDISTATTTQLVALVSSQKIYVTAWDVIAAGTGNVKLVYGTGTNCGTGTTDLTGNYNLTAQSGLAKGSGLGPVLVVPASQALCVTTSAAVQMSGSLAFTQF